jgi:hypothetical protein
MMHLADKVHYLKVPEIKHNGCNSAKQGKIAGGLG